MGETDNSPEKTSEEIDPFQVLVNHHEQEFFDLGDIEIVYSLHDHLAHIETLDEGGKPGIDDPDQLP